jgi:hypothetical protein
MKNKIFFVIVTLLVISALVIIGIRQWGASEREKRFKEWIRDETRYAGATGEAVTAFDNRTNRWLAELKAETIEETLPKLTDAMEYLGSYITHPSIAPSLHSEIERENVFYCKDIEALLGNRRFRKTYEDFQKMNKRQASELITKNIKNNLIELRIILQRYKDMISRGDHKIITGISYAIVDTDTYRPMSPLGSEPTATGRRYAVFSYIVLAAIFELREVHPVIEEVIELAKEQYELFNSADAREAFAFKQMLLQESLYNPSLLITATFCDPTWKVAEKKRLPKEKFVEREVVDYRARALETDKLAREGWIPVVPYEGMLKIRYYKGITDAEFNDFFGK